MADKRLHELTDECPRSQRPMAEQVEQARASGALAKHEPFFVAITESLGAPPLAIENISPRQVKWQETVGQTIAKLRKPLQELADRLVSKMAADSDNISDVGNEIFYTGRWLDPATGLQLNRNRWYSQQLGRWTSRDPIGYEGGTMNLYEYVNSMPGISLDSDGLQCTPVHSTRGPWEYYVKAGGISGVSITTSPQSIDRAGLLC